MIFIKFFVQRQHPQSKTVWLTSRILQKQFGLYNMNCLIVSFNLIFEGFS